MGPETNLDITERGLNNTNENLIKHGENQDEMNEVSIKNKKKKDIIGKKNNNSIKNNKLNKNIDEHRGFSFNEVKYSVNKTVKDIKSDIEINKNYKPRK